MKRNFPPPRLRPYSKTKKRVSALFSTIKAPLDRTDSEKRPTHERHNYTPTRIIYSYQGRPRRPRTSRSASLCIETFPIGPGRRRELYIKPRRLRATPRYFVFGHAPEDRNPPIRPPVTPSKPTCPPGIPTSASSEWKVFSARENSIENSWKLAARVCARAYRVSTASDVIWVICLFFLRLLGNRVDGFLLIEIKCGGYVTDDLVDPIRKAKRKRTCSRKNVECESIFRNEIPRDVIVPFFQMQMLIWTKTCVRKWWIQIVLNLRSKER